MNPLERIEAGRDADLAARRREFDERLGEHARAADENFLSASGEPKPALCDPTDLPDLDVLRDLGYPGEFPYTRGIHPTMFRGRRWTMRQFSGFGTAADTNRRYKFLLDHGQTGLSVAFDMPTLMGLDSDHPRSEGEVGYCGVAVSSLKDMETLFGGIALDKVSTSMTINGPAAVIFAYYLAAAQKQGVDIHGLQGTIQNDILKEYIAQKEYIFPPRPSLRIITDIMAFCLEDVPKWNTISISGYHIREAGSTAVQELAFTLADGFTYVEAGIAAGLEVDRFAPRLSFFFNSHMDFFEEIAKFRAARRIWAKRMRDRYGARDPRSWLLRFHTQTAGCSLTAQQPENNVVRTAIEALAAVLGGTQSLHTNSMDETLALPTEKAVKIALRTQQVIAHETGVADTIDPLGGSWFVESLTNRMEAQSEEYFRRIEEIGGVVAGIEAGYFQREIARAAYRYQQDFDAGRRVLVGVNRYQEPEEGPGIDTLRITGRVEMEQRRNLAELRARRDPGRWKRALQDLRDAARGKDNLMPRLLECAHAYATLGETADVLKEEFGEYREAAAF